MPEQPRKHPAGSPQRDRKPSSRVWPETQPPHSRYFGAAHSTRINAFVTSLGRRNQAKRDSR